MCSVEFLYKYMSFEQFVSMIETNKLYLSKITAWEDNYEAYIINYMIRKDMRFNGGLCPICPKILEKLRRDLLDALLNSLYAQSWTKDSHESDAMWKIYDKNSTGVRIKCKLDDIDKSISNAFNKQDFVVRKFCVRYEDVPPIHKDSFRDGFSPDKLIEYSLQIKRTAFQHEKEFRFILYKKGDIDLIRKDMEKYNGISEELKSNLPVLYYPFDIKMIHEILLNPRAKNYHEERFNEYCINHGLDKYNIAYRKSILYKEL